MRQFFDHAFIFATIFFTVLSQIIMRWQASKVGELPSDIMGKLLIIGSLLLSPWILVSIMATFIAGISWMAAMTKFQISYAYPFIGLNFVLMLFLGVALFDEHFNAVKLVGTFLIVVGIVFIAKG